MANAWGSKFSYVAMKQLAAFLTTYNMADQALLDDGTNVYNIEITGTGACCINGVYIPSLTANTEELLTAQEVTTKWLPNTVYAADTEVYFGGAGAAGVKFYKCLLAHTSDENVPPANSKTMWQDLPNLAGQEVADDFRVLIMVTAESDGSLGIWRASVDVAKGTVPTPDIPYFDPTIYMVVGWIDFANDTAGTAVTFGDTGGGVDFDSADGVFTQQIGPVFPSAANLPKN
jgi:hypothetical protein